MTFILSVSPMAAAIDTIGKTRRQGVELGLSGSAGAFDFNTGHSYVDATFRSTFATVSPHNSSAELRSELHSAQESAGQSNGAAVGDRWRSIGRLWHVSDDPHRIRARACRVFPLPQLQCERDLACDELHWQLGLTVVARSASLTCAAMRTTSVLRSGRAPIRRSASTCAGVRGRCRRRRKCAAERPFTLKEHDAWLCRW